MKESEIRIAELELERQYSLSEISRLESNVKQCDTDVGTYSSRVVDLEKEIETLRERLSNINRDHARVMNEQERALQAATEHDGETTEQMKDLLKRQGEQNAELRMNKDKVNNLQAELDRLRRQVHTLQQESADKEVKIVQLSKQHDHAKEDLMQMNMALDSKQQELELVCPMIFSSHFVHSGLPTTCFMCSSNAATMFGVLPGLPVAHLLPPGSAVVIPRCSLPLRRLDPRLLYLLVQTKSPTQARARLQRSESSPRKVCYPR